MNNTTQDWFGDRKPNQMVKDGRITTPSEAHKRRSIVKPVFTSHEILVGGDTSHNEGDQEPLGSQ